ncbi:hypothetical protein [Rhizobium bangladeshense]|nr:hypothetical protein [Rhizobium bangladeshense]
MTTGNARGVTPEIFSMLPASIGTFAALVLAGTGKGGSAYRGENTSE